MSETGFGLLIDVSAIGGVLGTLMAAPLIGRIGRTATLRLSIVSFAVLSFVPVFVHHAVAVGAAFFAQGLLSLPWNVVSTSLRQTLIPGHLLGRVGSVYLLVAVGTEPLGALIDGFLAASVGLVGAFAVSAACMAAVAVAAWRPLGHLVRDAEAVIAARARG